MLDVDCGVKYLHSFGIVNESTTATSGYTGLGTRVYIAPEFIHRRCYGKLLDWWILLLYQFLILFGEKRLTTTPSQAPVGDGQRGRVGPALTSRQ